MIKIYSKLLHNQYNGCFRITNVMVALESSFYKPINLT